MLQFEIFVGLTLFSFVIGSDTIKWVSNVSLIENEDEFEWRKTTLATTNVGQYKALYFSSTKLPLPDGIFGSAYAGGMSGQPPTIQMGYFWLQTTFPSDNPVNGDYSAAAGFIAATFIKLDEVTDEGEVIQSIPLDELSFSLRSVSHYNGTLSSSTFYAATGSGSITFAVSASSVIGLLTSGIVMTPETMGYGVHILGFPYLRNETSVRLTIAIVTVNKERGDNSREMLHNDRTTVGDGPSAVYMDIGTVAYCDGEETKVTIVTNHSATTDDLENYKLVNLQLTTFMKRGRATTIRTKQITFAPEAYNISYRTTIGTTQGPIVVGEELDGLYQLNGGQVAGVVIGTMIGIGLIGVAIFFFFARLNFSLNQAYEKLTGTPAAPAPTATSTLVSPTTPASSSYTTLV